MTAVPPEREGEGPEDAPAAGASAASGAPGEDRGDTGIDVDAAWADILAHWDAPAPAVGPWPAQEDAGPADGRGAAPTTGAGGAPPAPSGPAPAAGGRTDIPRDPLPPHDPAGAPPAHRAQPPAPGRHRRRTDDPLDAGGVGPLDGSGSSGGSGSPAARPAPPRRPGADVDGVDDPDEHWTPPEPPPLPRGGWRAWLPWVGVLGAPVFFLVVVLVRPPVPQAAMLLAVLAFVAGFVTLVVRLPRSRSDDDDDGAVV